jgi:hypothetical protein
LANTAEVVAQEGAALVALVGRRLTRAWAMEFVGDDDWICTAPVVLDFDGVRLEIKVEGFGLLYLSWGLIDLLGELVQDPDDPDLEIGWTAFPGSEIAGVLGGIVREVRILESEFRFDRVDGVRFEDRLLNGIEFVFEPDGRAIQFSNGPDELHVSVGPADSDMWRRIFLDGGRA